MLLKSYEIACTQRGAPVPPASWRTVDGERIPVYPEGTGVLAAPPDKKICLRLCGGSLNGQVIWVSALEGLTPTWRRLARLARKRQHAGRGPWFLPPRVAREESLLAGGKRKDPVWGGRTLELRDQYEDLPPWVDPREEYAAARELLRARAAARGAEQLSMGAEGAKRANLELDESYEDLPPWVDPREETRPRPARGGECYVGDPTHGVALMYPSPVTGEDVAGWAIVVPLREGYN